MLEVSISDQLTYRGSMAAQVNQTSKMEKLGVLYKAR